MTSSNRLIAILIGAVLLILLLVNSFFVVNEREQAIVTRFGQIQAVHNEPGLHFKAPFAFAGFDNVQVIEDRLLRVDLDDIRVQTSGGRFYIVNAFITYEIDNPIRFRQAASGDRRLAENRLQTRFEDAVRGVYGRRGFEAALSDARAEMMNEVTARLRPEAESLGLAIEDVRIRRTDLTPEVSEQTYERMRSERLAEAERLRARGNEAAQRIRARAERQVVEIESDAVREGEIIRGEGEGERNRIFAEAFGQDPEFFDFYRSMAAYRRALEDGDTTRMVLTPNSEFFRFFQEAGQSNPAGPITIPPIATITPDAQETEGASGVTVDPVGDAQAPGALAVPQNVVPGGEPGDLEEGPLPGDDVEAAIPASPDVEGDVGGAIVEDAVPSTGGEAIVTDEDASLLDGGADVTIVPVEPVAPTATQ